MQNTDENYLLTFDRKWFYVNLSLFVFMFAFATFYAYRVRILLTYVFLLIFRIPKKYTHTLAKILLTYASHILHILQIIYHSNHNSILIRYDFPLSLIFHYRLLFLEDGNEKECARARLETQCVQSK